MIQTRWSEDDPSGRILKEIEQGLRPDWEAIIFPAIAEEDDILGRSPGDALWPERYDIKYLESLKNRWDHDEAKMGAYWWEALYQQNPSPREGGLYKRDWFKFFEPDGDFYQLEGGGCWLESDCWKMITVDLAVSLKEGSDYFAVGVWGVTPNRDLMLLDLVHDRIAGPDQADIIEQVFHEHRPMLISVEATQYQLSLVQELVRRGLPARAVHVKGDKVARSQLSATRFAAGTVYLRRHAPWLNQYMDELLLFPNGRHDDLCDITSLAANELSCMIVPEVY
jgi:predicted phage terminase large subunit-like protein